MSNKLTWQKIEKVIKKTGIKPSRHIACIPTEDPLLEIAGFHHRMMAWFVGFTGKREFDLPVVVTHQIGDPKFIFSSWKPEEGDTPNSLKDLNPIEIEIHSEAELEELIRKIKRS